MENHSQPLGGTFFENMVEELIEAEVIFSSQDFYSFIFYIRKFSASPEPAWGTRFLWLKRFHWSSLINWCGCLENNYVAFTWLTWSALCPIRIGLWKSFGTKKRSNHPECFWLNEMNVKINLKNAFVPFLYQVFLIFLMVFYHPRGIMNE